LAKLRHRQAHALRTLRTHPPPNGYEPGVNRGKPAERQPSFGALTDLTYVPYKVQFAQVKISRLEAVFFRTSNGREPVRDWLLSLAKEERRQIGEDIAYVQFKWPIGKPRIDHLRGPVWEIRSSMENRIARTLFAVSGVRMVLLHGFIKKTQRTPEADIELAIKRYKEWHRGET
jgi:phage-related protein